MIIAFMLYIAFYDVQDLPWNHAKDRTPETPELKFAPKAQRRTDMCYCDLPVVYHRRRTREIIVGDPARGGVIIGGHRPVVMQSMLTCDTMDTAECVKQSLSWWPWAAKSSASPRRRSRTPPIWKHRRRVAGAAAACSHRGGHSFQTRGRPRGRPLGRGGPHQPRQLRRLKEIRHQGIHPRAIRRRVGADRGKVHAAGPALPQLGRSCASAPIMAPSATGS